MMLGLGDILKELRKANEKFDDQLGSINETLEDINHNLKILIDVEFATLPKKQQDKLSLKWEQESQPK
ncbi:MAG: hypothetical protein ACXADH_05700 [Candidatus Kariarchaeaceae archaeon]|jgi:hypothetical protein